MIPDGWKVERLKHMQGAIAVTNGHGLSREIYNYRDPLMYRFFDDLLRQTESEAPKPRKARGVISYSERERYTLDDADEEIQSLMDRDMGASG